MARQHRAHLRNQPVSDEQTRKTRWRLVLGAGAEGVFGDIGGDTQWAQRDTTLGFLYDREYGKGRNVRNRGAQGGAGLGESQLSIPDWINQVHELFPQKTIERIEKDALERYQLEELMTNPDLLKRAQPSETLLKAVLRTKHLMNQDVLAAARELIRKVVQQMLEKLAREVNAPFVGVRDRRRRSSFRIAKNFDARTTIRRNLKNFQKHSRRLVIETPYFHSRIRRQGEKWQIIILIDQSGSMVDSVIHSAITASIFCGINTIKTHLIAFDTNIVDLTESCQDPVETLMKVQLGGGTDIGKAMSYALTLIENPRNAIVILISDFFEGAPQHHLVSTVKSMLEGGTTVLGLAALDYHGEPTYDKDLAQTLVNMGAHVGAMTPGELAAWVSEKVR